MAPAIQSVMKNSLSVVFVMDEENSSETKAKDDAAKFYPLEFDFAALNTMNMANLSLAVLHKKTALPQNPYLDYSTPPPNL